MTTKAVALVCPYCGAPLPRTQDGATQLTCVYCRSTSRLHGVTAVRHTQGTIQIDEVPGNPELARSTIEAFQAARQAGASPYDALVSATRTRLGPLGETETFARVVLALGTDFDRENGTRIVDDPMCMGRLIETYLLAMEALRRAPAFDVNMPFFSATDEGPKHFVRTLTPADIATLAVRDPAAQPAKKKGFLGLW
jgi:hypothetical protein